MGCVHERCTATIIPGFAIDRKKKLTLYIKLKKKTHKSELFGLIKFLRNLLDFYADLIQIKIFYNISICKIVTVSSNSKIQQS